MTKTLQLKNKPQCILTTEDQIPREFWENNRNLSRLINESGLDCILTGSRASGQHTPDADIDIFTNGEGFNLYQWKLVLQGMRVQFRELTPRTNYTRHYFLCPEVEGVLRVHTNSRLTFIRQMDISVYKTSEGFELKKAAQENINSRFLMGYGRPNKTDWKEVMEKLAPQYLNYHYKQGTRI